MKAWPKFPSLSALSVPPAAACAATFDQYAPL